MKKGFLIGGGLIFAGLMLEMSIGPVVWDSFAWPVNGIVLAGFLAMIAGMFLLRKKVYAFSFIGTYQAAIPTLVYAVLLTIIMGLTRQKPGGTWLNSMLTFWPFVLIYVYMAVILGEVVLKRFSKLRSGCSIRDIAFLLNHLGLFITMTAATLGNADMQRLKMVTNVGVPEWCAVTQEGIIREMPMTIELKKFILETYDDGLPEQASPTPQLLPKRFASEIQVLTKSGKTIYATVDVNKPVEVDGWKIYQYGYDTQMGAMSQTSILELVSDPWLPLVYAGIYMMLVGAVSIIVYTRWNYKWMLLFATVLALVIICVYLFMPVMHSKTLMPALQSPWFIPHVMVYMFAYAVFGVATVMSIFLLIKKSRSHQDISLASIDNLVYVGLVFMTIGMLFGALWAKEAWGHYWSWDPKETWAAITWFSYLVFVHYRRLPKQKPCLALCLLILSFVLLQMCWWGINYLPSAQGTSVHTYN